MTSIPNSLKKERSARRDKSEAGAVRLLLRLSAPYKFQLLLACLCVVIVNGAFLIQPLILQRVIDHFLIGGAAQSGLNSIGGLALLYVTVAAAGGIFSYLQALIAGKAGQSLIHELRVRVFSIIERLPYLIWTGPPPGG